MAKKLVRYLLEGNGTIPAFVEDGGYWGKDGQLVGRSVDETLRHVPATVVRMTRADFIAWMTALELRDEEDVLLDAEEIEAKADAFLEQIGLADLA